MSNLISTQAIKLPESMTLLEICKLTKTRHSDTMKRVMPKLLKLKTFNRCTICVADTARGKGASPQQIETYRLTRDQSLIVAARLSESLLEAVVLRWQELEQTVNELNTTKMSKRDQKLAMAALKEYLSDDEGDNRINYIKANTVVNKATCNYHGFDKALKKGDMSITMLETRDKILDDYVKLFDVMQDNSDIAKILYKKYQEPLLTHQTGE